MLCVEFGFWKSIFSNHPPDPKLLAITDTIECDENSSEYAVSVRLIFIGHKLFEIGNLIDKDYFGLWCVRVNDNLLQRFQPKCPLFVEFCGKSTKHLINLIMCVTHYKETKLDFFKNPFLN